MILDVVLDGPAAWGAYRFKDYAKAGAPLVLAAILTPAAALTLTYS